MQLAPRSGLFTCGERFFVPFEQETVYFLEPARTEKYLLWPGTKVPVPRATSQFALYTDRPITSTTSRMLRINERESNRFPSYAKSSSNTSTLFFSSRAQCRISSVPESFLQVSLYVSSSTGVIFIHSFFHFVLHSAAFSSRCTMLSSILISNGTVDKCGNQRDKQQVSLKKTQASKR